MGTSISNLTLQARFETGSDSRRHGRDLTVHREFDPSRFGLMFPARIRWKIYRKSGKIHGKSMVNISKIQQNPVLRKCQRPAFCQVFLAVFNVAGTLLIASMATMAAMAIAPREPHHRSAMGAAAPAQQFQ